MNMGGTRKEGSDARFPSEFCWAWWPDRDLSYSEISMSPPSSTTTISNKSVSSNDLNMAECIDGGTGLARNESNLGNCVQRISEISTTELTQLFLHLIVGNMDSIDACNCNTNNILQSFLKTSWSLNDLRSLKRFMCKEYEDAKDQLLGNHRIFRQWKRRESNSS